MPHPSLLLSELHLGAGEGCPRALNFWGDLLLDFILHLYFLEELGLGVVTVSQIQMGTHGSHYETDFDTAAGPEKLGSAAGGELPLPLGQGASAGPMEFLGLEPPFRGSCTKGEQGTGRQNWHMINFISTRMAFCFVLCIFFLPKVFLKTHSKRT